MKLIKCQNCGDMVVLRSWRKACRCGLCYGQYLEDNRTVMVSPEATVFGMPNDQFFEIQSGDEFVIYRNSDTGDRD